MTTRVERTATLRRLHESGCFVIPNPWDVGTARALEQLGFQAVATTSSGFAWSVGRSDDQSSLEQALGHFRDIVGGVSIPVSGDFQDGFAKDPEGVATNVGLAVRSGLAGLSIEDSTRDRRDPLYDFELAVERVRAAREAAHRDGMDLVLTARTEGFIVGRPDLDETLTRLAAFAQAGADCLYAPGIRTREQISAVVGAVAPKAVNVLVGSDFTTVAELAELGVRRISVGGAFARVAWGAFLGAAEEIRRSGTFTSMRDAAPFADLDGRFAR